MKKRNAFGEDGVALEMILVLEEFGVSEQKKLFNQVYASGNILGYKCESVVITLP